MCDSQWKKQQDRKCLSWLKPGASFTNAVVLSYVLDDTTGKAYERFPESGTITR